ncbi:MAG: tetratricopeptide repeat protein [Candidatus Protochlamydia sp.]|nr:tetratricopeptide repeat protein [Candidatus Protochlamydia sp.]
MDPNLLRRNMDPAYLNALMHGEISLKKKASPEESKLEVEMAKEIDNFAESYSIEENPNHPSLLSEKAKRDRMKMELKEKMSATQSSLTIDNAMDLLFSESHRYLSREDSEQLLQELSESIDFLNDIGIENFAEANLQELANISDSTIVAIAGIAATKFAEGSYEDSLSLYSLLCIFNPAITEFWFRMGILTKKMGKIELALRAFAAVLELDPNHIGARLFAAECYLLQKQLEEAKFELAAAKEIVATTEVEQMWLDYILVIDDLIK